MWDWWGHEHITHHGAPLFINFGFSLPIEFDNVRKLISFGCDWTFFEVAKVGTIVGLQEWGSCLCIYGHGVK
jgi:hypothetical protein